MFSEEEIFALSEDKATFSEKEIMNLYNFGFTYKWFQTHPERGMRFYYGNSVYIIGGKTEDEFSPEENEIIKNGLWIPQAGHLLYWLQNNCFELNLCYCGEGGSGFTLYCKDTVTGTEYQTDGDFESAPARTIKKILKRKERDFDTENRFFIDFT